MPKKKTNKAYSSIVVVSLVVFIFLLLGSLNNSFLVPIDRWVYAKESLHVKPVIPVAMLLVTGIMNPHGAVILGIIAIVALVGMRKNKQALLLPLAMAVTYLLSELFKFLVQRPRPDINMVNITGFAFPSAHAAMATAYFTLLIYFFKDDFKNNIIKYLFIAFCIFMALLISYSRIYLAVHWLTDVLAGIALGLLATSLAAIAENHPSFWRKFKW
jgi:undecaprenyl-diphosphatase